MIVALDFDGVIYDWEQQARVMLEPIYGPIPVSTYWHFIKDRVRKEDWNRIWANKEILLGGGRCVEPFLAGRVQTVALLGNNKVIIVTSRRRDSKAVTERWLAAMGIEYDELHVIGEDPKTSIPFDILLDDKPEHVAEAIAAGRKAYLRDQPWNQAHDLPRVDNFNDFLDVLRAHS